MAEPVGLILSTVGLISLFTTCIELIDYFELSKTYEYDYEMACLKLSLLKSRLDTWGQTLQSGVGGSCQGQELGHQWPIECTVIHRSLQGIADIFGSAELLKDKYCLLPRKSRNRTTILLRSPQTPTAEKKGQRRILGGIRGISFVRRSTTWAIRDKQKFDNLISDLEFFISNLEAVSSRVHLTRHFSSETMEQTNQPNSTGNSADTTNPRDSYFGGLANTSTRRINASLSPAMMAHKQDSQQPTTELPNFTANGPSTSSSHTEEGYTWTVERMEGRSRVFYGTVGGAMLAPAPARQIVAFRVGVTTGDARVMGGTMSEDNFDTFFNGTVREASSSRHN